MQNLPNLIGVGGQKCASTWLSECLREHPDIFMSSPKELRYFTDNKERGLDWYTSFFSSSIDTTYRAEFSSNYLYQLQVADDIQADLGDVKIIAVVREPVSRSLSHIKHLIRNGKVSPLNGKIGKDSLIEIVKAHPKVVTNSLYYEGLSKFLEVFGPDAVFVVDQASCLNDPGIVLGELWEFLGLDGSIEITQAKKIVSAGVNPKYLWLEKLRRTTFFLAKRFFPRLINFVKRTGMSSAYRKVNAGAPVFFDDEAKAYIEERCLDDWKKTKALFCFRGDFCEISS